LEIVEKGSRIKTVLKKVRRGHLYMWYILEESNSERICK